MAVEEIQRFSAELRILEAECEKSKLQVFQDTLLCKRSMIELELLCKNEQLQKTARVNNRIKKQLESELKVSLEYIQKRSCKQRILNISSRKSYIIG